MADVIQNKLEGLDGLKTATLEKLAFCLALLKTSFSILHSLEEVLAGDGESTIRQQNHVSFVGFRPIALSVSSKIEPTEEAAEDLRTENMEECILKVHLSSHFLTRLTLMCLDGDRIFRFKI